MLKMVEAVPEWGINSLHASFGSFAKIVLQVGNG